jgi:hypothetical protein
VEALVPPGWAQRGDRTQSLHNTFTEQENFGLSADVDYVPATCEEVQCPGWRDGWHTALVTDDGRADYIRQQSGRVFREYTSAAWNEKGAALAASRNAAKQPGEPLEEFTPLPLGWVVFEFSAGQPCFQAANHLKTVAVNPLFRVRDHWGDVLRTHSGADPFLDDFRTRLERTVHDITS